MDTKSESNRITLSLGFITIFFALFFSTNFLPNNLLIRGTEVYCLVSSTLFFFYLFSTAISYKYKEDSLVGVGTDTIQFTNEEINKFRRWSFDAGLNWIFIGLIIPIFSWLLQYADHIKIFFAITFIFSVNASFCSAVKYFLKADFFRSAAFIIAASVIFGFMATLNHAAKELIDVKKDLQVEFTLKQKPTSTEGITTWSTIVNFIAGKNIFSDYALNDKMLATQSLEKNSH